MKATQLSATLCLALILSMAAAAVEASGNVEEGAAAPDFTLPDINPEEPPVTLSEFQGQVVYVDFWASWCLPCLRSLPQINALYREYRDQGFEVIAITVDTRLEDAHEFLEEDLDAPLDYLVATDVDMEIMDRYGVRGMPTSFLIDRDGMVRKIHEGFREGDIELLEEALQPLL